MFTLVIPLKIFFVQVFRIKSESLHHKNLNSCLRNFRAHFVLKNLCVRYNFLFIRNVVCTTLFSKAFKLRVI